MGTRNKNLVERYIDNQKKRSRLSQEKVFKYFFCDNRNEYQVDIFFCSIALIVTEDKCYKKGFHLEIVMTLMDLID